MAERVERLRDIRQEKLARVKAVEREKNELASVRDEAISYLKLVNEITRVKNVIYQQNRMKEMQKENKLRKELAELDETLAVRMPEFIE